MTEKTLEEKIQQLRDKYENGDFKTPLYTRISALRYYEKHKKTDKLKDRFNKHAKTYYQRNKEKILEKSKERYARKKQQQNQQEQETINWSDISDPETDWDNMTQYGNSP